MDIALEFYRAEQAEKPDIPLDGPTDYLVRTPSGGVENYTLDWAEWQERIAALDVRTTSPGALREIGTRLREALRGLRLSAAEADIVAASRREQPVIITIKSAAAEIARLPWELWVVKPTGQHLAELENVLLRYALPSAPAFARATAPEQPGRVVVAYAGDVAAAEHIAAVEEASHGLSFERDRDVIARLSPRRLREALDRAQEQNAPISVLHLLCHGTLQPDRTCALVWAGDSDDGREVMVDGADLARILGNHAEQVRLVVLSACHSANAGTLGNLLGSVAQELHRHGIETVIASRLALSMDGSVVFARHFYRALVAERTSVEQAFLAARRELALDHQGLDWARLQFFAQPRGDATTGTWPLGEPPRDGQVSARSEDAPGPAAPARPPARPSARAGADIEDRDGATPAPTFDALMARPQRDGDTPAGALRVWFEAVLLYMADDDAQRDVGRRVIQALTIPFRQHRTWDRKPNALIFRDRLLRESHIVRSYFQGATPENHYALPDGERTLMVREVDEEPDFRRAKVWLETSGASSPRPVAMKQSKTTKRWYVDTFSSVYLSVQVPGSPGEDEFA